MNEQHTTTTGPDYDTVRWRVLADNGKTEFLAERDENTIVIHGMLSGQPIDKVLKIDNAPWYQATSLSLRELIASGDSERIFWTIRNDALTVHKIRAVKKGADSVESGGSRKDLIHIRLTLPGLLVHPARGRLLPFQRSQRTAGVTDDRRDPYRRLNGFSASINEKKRTHWHPGLYQKTDPAQQADRSRAAHAGWLMRWARSINFPFPSPAITRNH